jgi:hypothetical protein
MKDRQARAEGCLHCNLPYQLFTRASRWSHDQEATALPCFVIYIFNEPWSTMPIQWLLGPFYLPDSCTANCSSRYALPHLQLSGNMLFGALNLSSDVSLIPASRSAASDLDYSPGEKADSAFPPVLERFVVLLICWLRCSAFAAQSTCQGEKKETLRSPVPDDDRVTLRLCLRQGEIIFINHHGPCSQR